MSGTTSPAHSHARLTLPALLAARAARSGSTPLFSDLRAAWTAAEAMDIAARRAGALAAHGIVRGDRVALLCANRKEFMEIVLGCAWLGAVVVPINTASRGMQLAHILRNSAARLMVAEAHLAAGVRALQVRDLALEQMWLIGETQGAEEHAGILPGIPMPAPGEAIAPADLRDGDPMAILYTSGTSGPSKGVVCPHAQFYWWGRHTGDKLRLVAGDVLYTCLPMFHTNALNTFFQALVHDAQMIADQRFSASNFFNTVVETGATVTYLLGAMVPILLGRPASENERGHRVRVALGPGVPAQAMRDFAARTGIVLIDGFGSTETNFVIGGDPDQQRPGYMGPLSAGFEARVVDEDDWPVPDGTAGELILRSDKPHAFASGYFGMPEKTVEAWRNLWFHTGDRVVREADGYYRFIDRIKDAIRRRGENISSYEVEQAIASHPAVETVAVYAVKSELAEDEVMAAVVLREGAQLDALELIRYCEPLLPYFAVPRYLDFTRDLPRTENGKIQKYKLRETGVTANTWDLESSGYRLKRT